MSMSFVIWAGGVGGLRTNDKFVLKTIAERVDKAGRWQIKMNALAAALEMSRNTLRAALDRLAARELLAFKVDVWRGKAQAAHHFSLLRDEGERRQAIADGYSFERKKLDRKALVEAGDDVERWSNSDRGVGQILTEGRSTGSPRVGQRSDRLSTYQKTFSKDHSCPNEVRTKQKYSEGFEGFWSAYPTDANMSKADAFEMWLRLEDADQRDAKASLTEFKRYCAARPDYRPLHAKNYLNPRSSRWKGHLVRVPRQALLDRPLPAPVADAPALTPLDDAVRAKLRASLGDEIFDSWFGRMTLVVAGDAAISMSLPSKYLKHHVERAFGEAVRQAVRLAAPQYARVEFVVSATIAQAAMAEAQ